MNLLKNNKTFEFFPTLNLKLLADKNYEQVNLISCNMQIPSLKLAQKKTNRNKINRLNSVTLNGDLYFYTGLKQYYKVNVKNEILADYFVEAKNNLLYLNKQKRERSEYLSGDYLFPMRRSYVFNKRRFILSLHTRDQLNTNEALVEPFAHIINDTNTQLLGSLLLKLYKSKNLPSLSFYKVNADQDSNAGKLFTFMGIQAMFLHKYSVNFKYNFVHRDKQSRYHPKAQSSQLGYLLKYLPNRHYFLLQYINTTLKRKNITSLIDETPNSYSFVRLIIKEFMSIKFFLRFYIVRLKMYYDFRLVTLKTVKAIKTMYILFNSVRFVYKNIFEYIFNLCVLQHLHCDQQSFFSVAKIYNLLNLATLYAYNPVKYKVSLFSSGFSAKGRVSFKFSNFNTGNITKQQNVYFFRQPKDYYRYRSKVIFYRRQIMNTRYRNALFHRRFSLFNKLNSFDYENVGSFRFSVSSPTGFVNDSNTKRIYQKKINKN